MFPCFTEEVPKEVLKCKAVSREIVFSSAEEVAGFRYAVAHQLRIRFLGTEHVFLFLCCTQARTESVFPRNMHRRCVF
jgi:hypothetical protein